MAKQKIVPRLPEVLRSAAWPIVAVVSLLLNAALISTWVYLLNYQPQVIEYAARGHICEEPGYSKVLAYGDLATKKFGAAALCFTDYETGKPLDINSVKPLIDTQGGLTPHPQ